MQVTWLMIDEMASDCGPVQQLELWQRQKSHQITEVISAAFVFQHYALYSMPFKATQYPNNSSKKKSSKNVSEAVDQFYPYTTDKAHVNDHYLPK